MRSQEKKGSESDEAPNLSQLTFPVLNSSLLWHLEQIKLYFDPIDKYRQFVLPGCIQRSRNVGADQIILYHQAQLYLSPL
jgi:hypothetical protein